MHRIITNSDTLTTRPATPEEIARAAKLRSDAETKRAEQVARYSAARARVLASGAFADNAAFERACRKTVEKIVIERRPYGEGIHTYAASCARDPRPYQWVAAAERLAEEHAPKLPHYAHQGVDPSARG